MTAARISQSPLTPEHALITLHTCTPRNRRQISIWLEEIGLPYGSMLGQFMFFAVRSDIPAALHAEAALIGVR